MIRRRIVLASIDLAADRRRSGGSVRQSGNVNRNPGAYYRRISTGYQVVVF